MSLESAEKKSPDSQVKTAQTAGNSYQLKNAQAMERTSSQKSQDALPNPVIVAPGSNLSRSPKLAQASGRKSHGVTKKASVSSNKSKQKVKLKKQLASTASTGHSDTDESDEDCDDGDRRIDGQLQDSKLSSSSASRSISMTASQRMAVDEWEILEGLKNGQLFEEVPQKYSGYMMKSRKWPMKGWHKRFFQLDNGILTYGKTLGDIEKGKHHGVVDIAHSVIACKRNGRRIDVDADDLIYHLKVKSIKEFDEWTTQLRHHRLHRHHEISYGAKDAPHLVTASSPAEEFSSLSSPLSPDGVEGGFDQCDGSLHTRTIERPQGKVSAWLTESNNIDGWEKELGLVQLKLFELSATLEKLPNASNSGSGTYVQEFQDLAISPISKKMKSSGKKPLLTKSSKKERKSKDRLSVADGLMSIHLSTSNPNLLTMDEPIIIGASAGNGASSTDFKDSDKLQELFYNQALEVHSSLKAVCRAVFSERERLKQALESDNLISVQNNANYIQSLKQTLTETIKQNTDYRNRLNRIHADSGLSDLKPIVPPLCLSNVYVASGPPSEKERMHFTTAGSIDSLCEFYDAAERLATSTDVSEDQEEEEEEDEDISDTETKPLPAGDELHEHFTRFQMRRRSKLPSPKVESDVGVWSLLRKNIGKDLSKISMPVSMNEPLNALQRLCEELEYSELLDRCAEFDDPFERMVWVAAFTVSGYSSTFARAGQKPFNPLLGETYENIRDDKGWKFISEQVSHHPPVSACFCESKNFLFWEDMQVRTKFWGKSMEVEPTGFVNVKLIKHKEHYTWNKATSCVHNILGGQRWVEHYGEVIITNHTLELVCKLTFAKSSYWSSNRHEVYGSVLDKEGMVVHHLFGKWNEGIYYGNVKSAKCIWRPGAMPPESSIYYGFTRFAMELNEIDSEQVNFYASTDTRFRPDQRLLEEGKLTEAENEKQRLEQQQREMRKKREETGIAHVPKWFKKSDPGSKDAYQFTNQYWEVRKNSGFGKMDLSVLW